MFLEFVIYFFVQMEVYMNAFHLKIIAVISMLFDHVGYFLNSGNFTFANYLGRLAFPIFAFQISEGYIHTKNLKKYLSRLGIFALISQIPFMLFEYSIGFDYTLNIFFTLFLGLLCIIAFDKLDNKFLSLLIIFVLCFIGEYIKVDYGYWGILLILLFFVFKNNKLLMVLSFLLMCIYKYLPYLINYNFHYAYIIITIATFTSIIPILLYNGKLGLKTKYLLYIFYPLHLLILYIGSLI